MNEQSQSTDCCQSTNTPSELVDAVIVGIDWTDAEHVVCLIQPNRSLEIDTLEQSPETIDAWVPRLIVALSRRKMAGSDRDRYQSAEEIQC